jgi:hypothetical protein
VFPPEDFQKLLPETEGGDFSPLPVDLTTTQLTHENEEQEEGEIAEGGSEEVKRLCPGHPNRPVVAIDATSLVLGTIEDGVVGATRCAVVKHCPDDSKLDIRLLGPYICPFTRSNTTESFNHMRNKIFDLSRLQRGPDYYRMPDRMRNFLEKSVQNSECGRRKDSIILFDGSLTVGTLDSPRSFMIDTARKAKENSNDILAVSKRTTLSLTDPRTGILSVLDGTTSPCYANVGSTVAQDSSRVMGELLVCRFRDGGRAFRTDAICPGNLVETLEEVGSVTDQSGYPAALKFAHICCIFTNIETIELQAAAARRFNMKVRENVRKIVFSPWR